MRSISTASQSPSEDFYATVDAALLKQAVRILADNAAKYTHEGDEIVFSLGRTDEGKIYLQVQDMGIAMAEGRRGAYV